MTSVLLRLRAELRSSWRSWAALALLAGLGGGLVITAAAGARRTETAVPRLAKASKLSEVYIPVGTGTGYANLDFNRVKRLPEVAYAYRADSFIVKGRTDRGRELTGQDFGLIASPDPRAGISVDRGKLIAGRRPHPAQIDEALPEENAARKLGLKVGSTFTGEFATTGQFAAIERANGDVHRFALKGPRATFRVVGITASFNDPTNDYPNILLTSAFHRRYARGLATSPAYAVRLRHGTSDIPALKSDVERLAHGRRVGFYASTDFLAQLQRGVHLQAGALWLLGALAAVAALLILAQAIAREVFAEADEHPTLRALGMTQGQLFSLAMARAGVIGAAGATLAAGLAILLSPIGPVGSTARKAEPHPGLSIDVLIVSGGALATMLLVLAVAAIPAWRAARASRDASMVGLRAGQRPSAVVDNLSRAGLPPTALTGVRMALERGRGRTAVPVGAPIFGVLLAVATIVAALGFSASVNRLVHTPRLYGQNWDAQLGDGYGTDNFKQVLPLLERSRDVGAFSAGTFGEASVGGKRTAMLAMDPLRGSVGPPVIDGRLPKAPDELLLATKTMSKLGVQVGDVVPVRVGTISTRLRVVGKAVLPDIVGAGIKLGRGGMVTFGGFRKLLPRAPRNVYLIRFRPGTNKKAALARLRKFGIIVGAKPVDLANFNRIDSMPFAIGGLIGSVAIATLAHTLITSIRRRRRDLAILKTLGFERGQVSGTVAWQATTIAALALLIGLPLGVASGRWAWNVFADQLGIVPEPVIPVIPILLMLPGALLVANLIALIPATIAGRTRAALVLRAE
jgi:ABC-type lipoprotein release transport system permease subunit